MPKTNLRTIALILMAAATLGLALIAIHYQKSAPLVSPVSAMPVPAAGTSSSAPVIRFVKNPEMAPPLQVKDILGKPVNKTDWPGKVVLVNFWATWCPPCREEIPELIELKKQYGDRLQIVGISEDEDPPAKVLKFAQQKGMNYPIVMATPELIDAYGGVPALPTSFLIDTQGRVVQKHTGLYPIESYHREIRSLLGMPTDARIETFVDTGQIFLKNAANATELPGRRFQRTDRRTRKSIALHRMNAENCTCGCGLTISQCRVNDSECPTSMDLAGQIVKESARTKPSPPPRLQGRKFHRTLSASIRGDPSCFHFRRGASCSTPGPAVTIPDPVVDNPLSATPGQETAVIAGGCFWGIQAVYEHVKGVIRATSGYSGGAANTAQYEKVCSGRTGHAEAVQVIFDPSKITFGQILKVFFSVAHDPTELNRQGPDVGTQYRSAIFFASEDQKRIAAAYVEQLNAAKVYSRPIATQIVPLDAFYPRKIITRGMPSSIRKTCTSWSMTCPRWTICRSNSPRSTWRRSRSRRWIRPSRRVTFCFFHLMLHPTLGFWSAGTARPARTVSRAARRSAPVTGRPFLGRLSSYCPR